MSEFSVFSEWVPLGTELPLVVSIPHTGTRVPEEIAANFASTAMRELPNTDWHLHQLYNFLPELGVRVIHANYSRFVVDLNRPPEGGSLYPGRFETGLVPTQTFDGESIWEQAPDEIAIEERRRRYHAPYHARLEEMLAETRAKFGRAVLIDAHSIRSAATLISDELVNDIYLGNQEGATCGEWLIGELEQGFVGHDLKVVRNHPFKGGYITRHYGAMDNVEACQIEMAQRVYMDEDDPQHGPDHDRFDATRQILRRVIGGVIARLAD